MRSRPVAAWWMGSAFCAALALAAAMLATKGAGSKGTTAALLLTARLSFLLFWPAYAGAALAALFGSVFQWAKRHGREFGLAFASAQLVHLCLVAWLCAAIAVPDLQTFVVFGIAVFWVYLLAILSNGRLQRAIGPKVWRVLRIVRMNYVAVAFALDFLKEPFGGGLKHVAEYAPFATLAVAGPVLRITVLSLRVGGGLRRSAYRTG